MRPEALRRALARTAVAAAALVASTAAAQPVPLRVYPLDTRSVSAEYASDARALIESAIANLGRRSERLAPASPLFQRRSCGTPPMAECLARLAGDGVVVTASVQASSTTIDLTLEAIDGAGRVYGPVVATVDAFLQSSAPVLQALQRLEARLESPERAVASAAKRPSAAEMRAERQPTPVKPAERSPPQLQPAPPRSAPLVSLPARPAEPARLDPPLAWGTAGKWTLGAGVALLAGGAVCAGLGQRLSSDLTAKYEQNRLTQADASSYRAVRNYEVMANSLLVAGGVATAAGMLMWSIAPAASAERGRVQVGVTGRF